MRAIVRILLLGVLLVVAYALVGPYVDDAIYAIRLASMPAPDSVSVPVRGVTPKKLTDTWQAARSGGRKHEGIDIFAPRGTPVHSATEGIVMRVGNNRLGGQVVWVLGPGGQRHYYAHLDRFADVARGLRVRTGTVIGYVGNTGNAAGTPPHLHYGIYEAGGAINPYPVLRIEEGSSQSGKGMLDTSATLP
ncbi:M23 family metallopeptidase [Massilia sp. RP-1-19]|uniref:M23 family metallopeptidase n=1 Tax=Massilia polaris TaxID=2728846 RepID=A0A848HJ22_9BURK|nr:M23 family metallopeptidase [Massilia polaris]NML60139.1 M23 family metallopeptidase [Massilia polaris]